MFPKVKNVNVESLKNGSKLLDFFVARRSDESRHLLLPFPVLRSLQTLRMIRTIRVLNSIRLFRVQTTECRVGQYCRITAEPLIRNPQKR